MYLLRRSDLATLLAPLAQWVGSDEAVAHTLPHPAVPFLHSRVALVVFVPLGFLLGTPWGWGCLLVAAGLEAAGVYWMRRLVAGVEAQL